MKTATEWADRLYDELEGIWTDDTDVVFSNIRILKRGIEAIRAEICAAIDDRLRDRADFLRGKERDGIYEALEIVTHFGSRS